MDIRVVYNSFQRGTVFCTLTVSGAGTIEILQFDHNEENQGKIDLVDGSTEIELHRGDTLEVIDDTSCIALRYSGLLPLDIQENNGCTGMIGTRSIAS